MELLSTAQIGQLSKDVGAEIMPELVDSMKTDIRKHIESLQMIMLDSTIPLEDEMRAITFAAHSLKGVSRSFGLDGLAEVGEYMEITSRRYVQMDSESQQKFCAVFLQLRETLDGLYAQSMQALDGWMQKQQQG